MIRFNVHFCGPYMDRQYDEMSALLEKYPEIKVESGGGDVGSYFILQGNIPLRMLVELRRIDEEAEKAWEEWES